MATTEETISFQAQYWCATPDGGGCWKRYGTATRTAAEAKAIAKECAKDKVQVVKIVTKKTTEVLP